MRYLIMADKKITKKEMFAEIKAIVKEMGRTDLVDFCNHELELLDRKAEKSKSNKTKTENLALAQTLALELMEIGKAVTVSEFMKLSPTVAEKELSNQKVTSLFGKSDEVTRTVIKGKAYYSVE